MSERERERERESERERERESTLYVDLLNTLPMQSQRMDVACGMA